MKVKCTSCGWLGTDDELVNVISSRTRAVVGSCCPQCDQLTDLQRVCEAEGCSGSVCGGRHVHRTGTYMFLCRDHFNAPGFY